MSDTDDTDDLLLIPPDFFLIDSDSSQSAVEPYYCIVDNLIQKVSDLQERIQYIETGSSLDYTFDNPRNMQQFRRCNSTDDLYIPQSTQSTPQKPHTKFKLNSLPASPNTDKFSPLRTGRVTRDFKSATKANSPRSARRFSPDTAPVKDGEVLNEVDTFLAKVRTIQRISASRNLERDFGDTGNLRIGRNAGTFDPRQNVPENQIHQNQSSVTEPVATKTKIWKHGDTKESVPDYGTGMRDNMYKERAKPPSKPMIYHRPTPFNNSVDDEFWLGVDKYPSSDSGSDSTQITACNNYMKERNDLLSPDLHIKALNTLNMHKKLLENDPQKLNIKNKLNEPKPRGANTLSDNLGLLNLADIWSTNVHSTHPTPAQLMHKLQEEKLRRQHCEGLIQELQNRNLELQQKLSVAVRVDDSKNNTIQQFQEALGKVVSRLEKFNKDNHDKEQEIADLKSRHVSELEEASQKVTYYEKEASKALNLAHSNQDKLVNLEKRCSDFQEELQNIERKCKQIEDEYSKELERNKQLTEILGQREIELNENKTILNEAKSEISQSKKAVEVCQSEFTLIKAECTQLREDLRLERDQIDKLKEEKRFLMNEVEDNKKREAEMKEELGKLRKMLESNKVELRNFYQGQVEILVQNKLKEFQGQLDQAEKTFKEEVKKREVSIAKSAATHIHQVSEKYSLEINLLEKKHQEEIKLFEIQIMQYKQQTEGLQTKLEQMHDKRIIIAKQLQKIMESQWAEALRIITKSPVVKEDTFNTIDQLKSLKTKSYNNVEEVLAQQHDEPFGLSRRPKNLQLHSYQNEEPSLSNNFEKMSQEAFNMPVETPVSSRTQGNKQYSESDIQKYINLLLNRPPGNPTHDSQKDTEGTSDTVMEKGSWQQFNQEKANKDNCKKTQTERFPKPPWK